MIRISTAPARPLTDLEEFKRSPDFLILEQVVITSTQLLQKSNQKYDLDSPEGQKICKKYLNLLEKLCDVTDFSLFKTVFSHFLIFIFKIYINFLKISQKALNVKTSSRDYRNEFSKAYKILYKEGCLCYLTEILDSAQEGLIFIEFLLFMRKIL